MGTLANIRPFFRTHLDALGFKEWDDGFNFDDIPETVIDKSYHVLTETTQGGPINHTHQNTTTTVAVRLFFKGYRNVSEGLDVAIAAVESVVNRVCKVSNRTSGVFNVIFIEAVYSPFKPADDNTVFVEMKFEVAVILGVEES